MSKLHKKYNRIPATFEPKGQRASHWKYLFLAFFNLWTICINLAKVQFFLVKNLVKVQFFAFFPSCFQMQWRIKQFGKIKRNISTITSIRRKRRKTEINKFDCFTFLFTLLFVFSKQNRETLPLRIKLFYVTKFTAFIQNMKIISYTTGSKALHQNHMQGSHFPDLSENVFKGFHDRIKLFSWLFYNTKNGIIQAIEGMNKRKKWKILLRPKFCQSISFFASALWFFRGTRDFTI